MFYRLVFVAFIFAASCFMTIRAQDSLLIEIDTIATESNANGELMLRVRHFTNLVSLQFSINWAPEVATFVSATTADLSDVAIGQNELANGQLRFSWFSPDGLATSLADGSAILSLRLLAIGQNGEETAVQLTNTPLAIQVFRGVGNNGEFEETGLISRPGLLRIQPSISATITTNDVDCHGSNTGSINWTTEADTSLYTFVWTNESGQTIGTALTNLVAGIYTLSIRNLSGELVFQTTAQIRQADEVLSFATIEASGGTCENAGTGGQIVLEGAGGTPPYRYELGGMENTTGVFSDLVAATYQLRLIDDRGCVISAAQELTAPIPPNVQIVGDTLLSLCGNTAIEVVATSNDEPVSYQWSNGANTSSTSLNMVGTYQVVATSLLTGCRDTASVEVIDGRNVQARLESPLFPICPADTLAVRVSGGTEYRWLGDISTLIGAADSPNVGLAPATSQAYEVLVASDCATDTLSFELIVFDVLATAGPDTCIAPLQAIELYASGGLFYLWEENNDYPLSDLRIPNPTVMPLRTTTYRVQIEDENACLTTDELSVILAENPAENISAINAITPNGDGINDVLEFEGIAKFGTNTLKVYNRWGGLIYNRVNYQNDGNRFDGTYLGEPLPEGTYYYTLEFAAGIIKQSLFISR